MPVIPTLREAEVGRSVEVKNLRPLKKKKNLAPRVIKKKIETSLANMAKPVSTKNTKVSQAW